MRYSPSNLLADPGALQELQRIAEAIEWLQTNPSFPQRAKDYSRPFDGQVAIADGANWDPLGDGVKKPVWYDKATQTWNNFGEGTGSALVHAVVGTAGQISVNNTDQQNPVLSLAAAVLLSLAKADSAIQLDTLPPYYLTQTVTEKFWTSAEILQGHTIIGVRYAGPVTIYLPSTLSQRKLVTIKDERGLGDITVLTYEE